jgi:hypothetical protein
VRDAARQRAGDGKRLEIVNELRGERLELVNAGSDRVDSVRDHDDRGWIASTFQRLVKAGRWLELWGGEMAVMRRVCPSPVVKTSPTCQRSVPATNVPL